MKLAPTFAALLVVTSLGCRARAPSCGAPTDEGAVVATVNGVAIGATELEIDLGRVGHHATASDAARSDPRQNIREALIRKELAAQAAVALGLDADPAFQRKIERMEAELRNTRRQLLADLYYRHETSQGADAVVAEARRLFDANRPIFQREVHVAQIMLRDRAAIARAREALAGGASFDAVYTELVGPLPTSGEKPWDLGYLGWKQIPADWMAALGTLERGETSSVISGPGGRYWVIRLLDWRDATPIDFDEVQADLVGHLRGNLAVAARHTLDTELHRVARIDYRSLSSVAPPHAETASNER